MSLNILKLGVLYETLRESIEYEKAVDLNLSTNVKSVVDIDGLKLGVKVEKFPQEYKFILGEDNILSNNFNPNTYYNIGFDINESTDKLYDKKYGFLAKVLGIVSKSVLGWIIKNQPDVVIIFSDVKDKREFNRKISIFASILQNNKQKLYDEGYRWDFVTFKNFGKGLYIANKKLWK